MATRNQPSAPHRAYRVADQLQRDLAELIAREVRDPRVGLVTISDVEVSPDYAYAKVGFTVLVGDPQASEVALNEAAGFLHRLLFKRLRLHTVPTLHFYFDHTTERAADLDALIERAVAARARDTE